MEHLLDLKDEDGNYQLGNSIYDREGNYLCEATEIPVGEEDLMKESEKITNPKKYE